MPPKATLKRPLEDADQSTPVKRGRGRPRKDPNASAPPPKDISTPARGRGRPPKDPNSSVAPSKATITPSRGRGRLPRKASAPPPKEISTPARGRGRPPKVSNSSAPPPKATITPTRGRGRPPKDPKVSAPPKASSTPARRKERPPKDPKASAPPKANSTPALGRGRPAKNSSAVLSSAKSPKIAGHGRGRGRPRKNATAATPSSVAKLSGPPKQARGRGRPRKSDVIPGNAANPPTVKPDGTPTQAARGSGRPRKSDAMPTNAEPSSSEKQASSGSSSSVGRSEESDSIPTNPASSLAEKPAASGSSSSVGRPEESDGTPTNAAVSLAEEPAASSAGLRLSNFIGVYVLDCEEVDGNWPGKAKDLYMTIHAFSHTKTGLTASFNLGIIEGTMLLAADEASLARLHRQMDNDDTLSEDDSVDAIVRDNRRIYFIWRGRDATGDSPQVYSGFVGTQKGMLQATGDNVTSFEGSGSFPAGLGNECMFSGNKVSDEADEWPEPWINFSETAGTRKPYS